MVVALAHSFRIDAQGAQRSLERALAIAESDAVAGRERLATTAERVARVLHNFVQGELLAVSLQLRIGQAGERDVAELVERIDRILRDPVAEHEAESSAQEVRDAANAVIVSWTRAMTVTSEADPDGWRWLSRHPDGIAVFFDANTEALTNAFRHSAAASADLRLVRIPDGVRLLVRNPGRLAPTSADGIGIGDLRRRAARVELVQEDPGTVLLTVDITAPDEPAEG